MSLRRNARPATRSKLRSRNNVAASDAVCKDGKLCLVALSPHVCKPPQPAGAACKRDVVCASKKCAIPVGKDAGSCK
jgi:hypothetical protein